MVVTVEQWAGMTTSQRVACAEGLVPALPEGFEFVRVCTFRLGKVRHQGAEFEHRGDTFVLVPGGEVDLGFDASGWTPDAAERRSWESTARSYDIKESVQEHIASAVSPPRKAVVAPMLIEATAQSPPMVDVPLDEPRVQELIERHLKEPRPGKVEARFEGDRLIVSRDVRGEVTARRAVRLTHAELLATLARDGFSLPDADQWEWACSGGARTLYRWGDHAPCDRYPTDVSPAEREWKRQWVLSAGTLEYPPEGFEADWRLHREPNGFGLLGPDNPYQSELLLAPEQTRGGDGGTHICGGSGFFMGWLTLATAFCDPFYTRRKSDAVINDGYTVVRRVVPLGSP